MPGLPYRTSRLNVVAATQLHDYGEAKLGLLHKLELNKKKMRENSKLVKVRRQCYKANHRHGFHSIRVAAYAKLPKPVFQTSRQINRSHK